VLWAIGQVRPNTEWIPDGLLDERGFVVVDDYLRVVGAERVFAVGDVAATDPLRTSARARADRLVAHNVRAELGHGTPKRFRPLRRRWGSVVGAQDNRLEVFSSNGRSWTIPAWDTLWPWLVARSIYKGVRR
jgi:NADH dehydrogenase FAD-containing subunit